jgi:hypothetical protein
MPPVVCITAEDISLKQFKAAAPRMHGMADSFSSVRVQFFAFQYYLYNNTLVQRSVDEVAASNRFIKWYAAS